jgi:hypothetical protein
MAEYIMKSQSVRDKLKDEGKFTVLDLEVHVKAVTAMNESLENVRREFQIKDRESQRNAAFVTLTA